jgi:hypothetical protein
LALMRRRFPPPWTVEETDACFIVKDHTGHALAYVYFEEEPGRRAAARLLSRDEGAADRCEHRQAADLPRRRWCGILVALSHFWLGVTTCHLDRSQPIMLIGRYVR